jgi:hypothetical protein
LGVDLGWINSYRPPLGAGGAVCGVSAAIAAAAAVRAKKEYPPIAITLVIFWAILWIFALPLVSRALQLPTGVGGAWIGTSEFADAAGFAAVQSYGGMAGPGTGISGTADQAIWAYTLIKVVGRDVLIGIWAFVLAVVSLTRWEKSKTGRKVEAGQIWWRFPKFVIGFLVASIVVTWAVGSASYGDFNKIVRPALVVPITALRTWAFTFCFLSIGLTTPGPKLCLRYPAGADAQRTRSQWVQRERLHARKILPQISQPEAEWLIPIGNRATGKERRPVSLLPKEAAQANGPIGAQIKPVRFPAGTSIRLPCSTSRVPAGFDQPRDFGATRLDVRVYRHMLP